MPGGYPGMGFPGMGYPGVAPFGGIPVPADTGNSSEKGPMPSGKPTQYNGSAGALGTMPVGFQTNQSGYDNSQSSTSAAPYYWYGK
jgi:hypothetical protein